MPSGPSMGGNLTSRQEPLTERRVVIQNAAAMTVPSFSKTVGGIGFVVEVAVVIIGADLSGDKFTSVALERSAALPRVVFSTRSSTWREPWYSRAGRRTSEIGRPLDHDRIASHVNWSLRRRQGLCPPVTGASRCPRRTPGPVGVYEPAWRKSLPSRSVRLSCRPDGTPPHRPRHPRLA